MTTEARTRVPVKTGFFTIPADPSTAPQLMGSTCSACGESFFPKRVVCAKCLHEGCDDVLLSPRGTIYSFTWVHMPLFGSNQMELSSYGVGQVDLPEGPRVQFPLAGKQEEYTVGLAVTAELVVMREEGTTDVMMYRFRPAGGAS